MRNLFTVTKYTIVDILNQKSFFVLLAVCIGFVMMLRGCYKGNYMVNGKEIDSLTVAWNASIVAFHAIAAGVLCIAAILSMGLLRKDKDDGTLIYMISKPLPRAAYILGRVIGLWVVSFGFMVVLHGSIFVITLISAGGTMPGYLTASLLCSINVLFVVGIVCLFSLVMPDFMAAVAGLGIAGIGYISDSVFQLTQNHLVQAAMGNKIPDVSWWRVAWPKIASLQYYAASLIDKSAFQTMGPLHPLFVMVLYCGIVMGALVYIFKTREL